MCRVVVGNFYLHLLHYPMQELELEFLVFKGCILSTEFLKEMAYHMKEGIYEGLGVFNKDRQL